MADDPSSKRLRSPGGSAHTAENVPADLESRLLSAINALSVKMDLVINSIRDDFDKKLNVLSDSVKKQLAEAAVFHNKQLRLESDKLESFINAKVAELPPSSIPRSFETRIDKLERDENLNVLIVKGIPVATNERISDLVETLCKAINYQRDMNVTISSVFRLPPKSNRNSNNLHASSLNQPASSNSVQPSTDRSSSAAAPLVVVRFYSFDDKQHFFNCYLKSKLNLQHFGFKTATRVYINEKLTAKNNEILRAALELKKSGRIFNYHTFRGLVFVRALDDSKSICVMNKSDLESFSSA